jgi:HAD superfamily hydrolase (TIGR01509 family)
MASKLPAIIFDMDGVITDTESLHKEAELRVLAELGVAVPEEEWVHFKGQTEMDIFGGLFARHAPEREFNLPEIIERKTEIYLELGAKGLPTVPGAVDFIRDTKQYFEHTALATSSNEGVQRATFDQHELWPYFDQVVTGDLVTNGKPDPEIYALACERLGLDPASCWVIEDSDNGVRSATAAGCAVIGITTSFPVNYLTECGAKLVVDHYDQLRAHLVSGKLRELSGAADSI